MANTADSAKHKETEEICFHNYTEHLKRLQGGDFKKPCLKDNKYFFKYPTGNELFAFLDIGAEAERRNELQFQEMKCCIDNLTKENDCLRKENAVKSNTVTTLQKKIAENESVIVSLTSEVDKLNYRYLHSRDPHNSKMKYESDKESLIKENEAMCYKLKELHWKFCKLKEEHDCWREQLEEKDCELVRLAQCLKEKDGQLQDAMYELNSLRDKESLLEAKVISLEDQLQSQYDEFAEKSYIYQKAIDDLESHVSFLEKSLSMNIPELSKNNALYKEMVNQPCKLQEPSSTDQVTERDRILQELVAKMELKDKNVMQLKRLQNQRCLVSDKEYNHLLRLIDEQAFDIERLTSELQNKSLEDNDSAELLNEVSDLKNALCDSVQDPHGVEPLSRRIKRLRIKIKSRLQREDTRRKELSRQLGIYRCQFVALQKEIEELRQMNSNHPSTIEDIRLRMEKEKALSAVIYRVNKQRREVNANYLSLSKALTNLEKVNEFLMNLA